MLVDINLLPQKEGKSVTFLVILAIIAVLFVLVTALYIHQINATKTVIASTDNEIAQTQQIEASLQKQLGTSATGNSVNQLKTGIQWALQNRIETIPVITQLTALLPARGFIQSFAYQDSGTVTLSVQFDTSAEAAAYLNNLNHLAWITSASLTSLNTASNNSGAASGSQTYSANTASTAQSQTNSANAASASQSQPNSANAASAAQSQTNSLNTAANTKSTAVDSNTAPSTADTNPGAVLTASQNNELPRYIGQFTIQLNQKAVEKAIELSKGDEKGVAGS